MLLQSAVTLLVQTDGYNRWMRQVQLYPHRSCSGNLGVGNCWLLGGISPDTITFTSLIKCCAKLGDVSSGPSAHVRAINDGG